MHQGRNSKCAKFIERDLFLFRAPKSSVFRWVGFLPRPRLRLLRLLLVALLLHVAEVDEAVEVEEVEFADGRRILLQVLLVLIGL